MRLTWSRTIDVALRYDGAGTLGNFAAAGGAYVTPTGELMLYAAPHSDVDTFALVNGVPNEDWWWITCASPRWDIETGSATTPLAKTQRYYCQQLFRPRRSRGPTGAQGKSSISPWVELFDDVNFRDRSIKVNYRDRALYELSNFNNLDGFNDKTSSVRWRLPVGMSVELYDDDNFRDTRKVLVGNGNIQQISNLGGFGDKVSSMRFVGTDRSSILTYAWDLDGDGVFGETGGAASRGDENTRTPTFRAGASDGPNSLSVFVRVSDATGRSSTASVPVQLLNAPPTVSITGPTSATASVPLTFILTANDPSAVDRLASFTYFIDFGDGNSTQITSSPSQGSPAVTVRHAYARNGLYCAACQSGGSTRRYRTHHQFGNCHRTGHHRVEI